jgi:2-amino-4-hydroxy-6-hydroxymethyldihydropteridine diphosphokinase
MSLIIALGSNLGDKEENLNNAITEINQLFPVKAKSHIYFSKAIEYTSQPDFFNMCIECELPSIEPSEAMQKLLEIELKLGRQRDIPKGPRSIDIDILFWSTHKVKSNNLIVPHPRWFERSFVVLPLSELPFYETLKKCFTIPKEFNNEAKPLTD